MRFLSYLAVGGAVGTIARYLLAGLIQARVTSAFPTGTLIVNVSGSLLLGFLLPYSLSTPAISPEIRAALVTGLCGGYTTFSTFSYETAALVQEGDWKSAGLYLVLSVV